MTWLRRGINKARGTIHVICIVPRVVSRAGGGTPDSVVCRHLSPRTARAAPGLAGATRPRRCGCGASERGGARALRLPHDKPAPRTLLPIGRRSRLAAGIAAGAGAPLARPFTPHLCPWAIGGSALCCRLASRRRRHRRAPACCFAGRPSACAGWESGSSSGESLQRRHATSVYVQYNTRHALPQTGVRNGQGGLGPP